MPFDLRMVIEIFVLFLGIYLVLRVMEGTRGVGIFKGLIIAMLVAVLALMAIAWVLKSDLLFMVSQAFIANSILVGIQTFNGI